MELTELKIEYDSLQKKYNLPAFDEMNRIFDIGKIERDSGNLIRDIRRLAVEKIAHYLRLMELMQNPSQASPMFLMLLKEVNAADKQILDTVFSVFIEIELSSYKLDVDSTDKDEAEFIKKVYIIWNSNRTNLTGLLSILERNWKNMAVRNNKSRDYFN